jgi:hypothetical protein
VSENPPRFEADETDGTDGHSQGHEENDDPSESGPSDDALIADLQTVASEIGEVPCAVDVRQYGEYPPIAYHVRFGSWAGAVTAAQLVPSSRHNPFDTPIVDYMARRSIANRVKRRRRSTATNPPSFTEQLVHKLRKGSVSANDEQPPERPVVLISKYGMITLNATACDQLGEPSEIEYHTAVEDDLLAIGGVDAATDRSVALDESGSAKGAAVLEEFGIVPAAIEPPAYFEASYDEGLDALVIDVSSLMAETQTQTEAEAETDGDRQ